jgi:hypothetical protein
MKSKLRTRFMAAVVAAIVGLPAATIAAAPTFSIAVHLAYADGSSYDIVLATDVPAAEVSSMLADCGRSHRTGSVVRYHCYAIAD